MELSIEEFKLYNQFYCGVSSVTHKIPTELIVKNIQVNTLDGDKIVGVIIIVVGLVYVIS